MGFPRLPANYGAPIGTFVILYTKFNSVRTKINFRQQKGFLVNRIQICPTEFISVYESHFCQQKWIPVSTEFNFVRQNPFLYRQNSFLYRQNSFLKTSHFCQQKRFLSTQNSLLSNRIHFCRQKSFLSTKMTFVKTEFNFVDKIHFCHDRIHFCRQNSFLSLQNSILLICALVCIRDNATFTFTYQRIYITVYLR